MLLGLAIHGFVRCTRCVVPAAPAAPAAPATSPSAKRGTVPSAATVIDAVAAAPRRAAALTSLWLGMKLALVAAESCVVQLIGFEVFQARVLLGVRGACAARCA